VEHRRQEIRWPPGLCRIIARHDLVQFATRFRLVKNLTVPANPAHNTAYHYTSHKRPRSRAPIPAQRFNAEFLPRIAERVQSLFHGTLNVELLSHR
jgi:hypothetical protein